MGWGPRAGDGGAGHNGGAISDGNARHVGMRRTPPPLIANHSWYFLLTTLEMLTKVKIDDGLCFYFSVLKGLCS